MKSIGLVAAAACLALLSTPLALAAETVGWLAKRQIGGHSGDVLGAVQQAAEIACLITTAAMLT